jgi:preprotein translocase subunit SecD
MHLLLEVDIEKAVSLKVLRDSHDLQQKIKDEKVRTFASPEVEVAGQIALKLMADSERVKLEDLVNRRFPDYTVGAPRDLGDGKVLVTLKLTQAARNRILELTPQQVADSLRRRVDPEGVREPEILVRQDGLILVQLPDEFDPAAAKKSIGQTGNLEFKLVVDKADPKAPLAPGTEVNQLVSRDRTTGRPNPREALVLRSRASMTGETITDARVQIDSQHNEPYVSLTFNSQGARQFDELTAKNVGQRLAIVLDGVVQSAPVIKQQISGGEASISGDFTMEEARSLAVVLKSVLPAPVRIQYESTVGPSLGRDSINHGLMATLVGGLAVILFMGIYYKLTGLAADFAVVFNVIILLAVMAAFKATLTLPGIAGIILTIGMAVDANVLINERIREELRLGKTTAGAVEAGYARATVTIIDAHVTTVVSALVLYQFGTGPIKGFAVTLMIGLASSLFTSIIVTRLIFDYVLNRFRPKTLSI